MMKISLSQMADNVSIKSGHKDSLTPSEKNYIAKELYAGISLLANMESQDIDRICMLYSSSIAQSTREEALTILKSVAKLSDIISQTKSYLLYGIPASFTMAPSPQDQ